MSNRQRLYRRGDYLSPVFAAHASGMIPPGTLTAVEIRHDDDCRRPDGGPCTCRPDVELVIKPDLRRERTG